MGPITNSQCYSAHPGSDLARGSPRFEYNDLKHLRPVGDEDWLDDALLVILADRWQPRGAAAGALITSSQLAKVRKWTPTSAAAWSCVSPKSSRRFFMRLPKVRSSRG